MVSVLSRVEIVAYREDWPREFERIAERLRSALGDLAARIDHIGSTSVPGLASKDRIDVQIGVASLDRLTGFDEAMRRAGYERRAGIVRDHRPPGDQSADDEWRKYFYVPRGDRATNVHVREVGRHNWRYALLFRDYLRARPAAAAGYAEAKRRLVLLAIDTNTYADAKDPICDIIMAAAEDWAAHTAWRP
jgi:GrpB-like predicted nucleotidyltransferase (UPF0157 family)